MSVTHTVFSIIELLEHILSGLPPWDIIRLKRVNRTWNRLITDSPTLQYKTWSRNEPPNAAHTVRSDDIMPELNASDDNHSFDIDRETEYEANRFIYNITKHLHPIIAKMVLDTFPHEFDYTLGTDLCIEENGFLDGLSLPPLLLRELLQWYEKNKPTENRWGKISLYRPHIQSIELTVPDSDQSGTTISHCVKRSASSIDQEQNYGLRDLTTYKDGAEMPFLTLSDFFVSVYHGWEEWLDWELELHYLSHDGQGCDLDRGIPSDDCLASDYEYATDGDEVYDDDDDDDDDEEEEEEIVGDKRKIRRSQFGYKGSREYYIEDRAKEASDPYNYGWRKH